MRNATEEATINAHVLLGRLRAYCFPYGEEKARLIRSVRTSETGQMRMSPEARWIPFTAEQTIDATRSCFHWEARLDPGRIATVTVIDAYQQSRGRLEVKVGGLIPVKKIEGLEADRGELQRYLASIVFCPAILLNNLSLEYEAVGARALRIRDRNDQTGAIVDLEISEQGQPLNCRAERPRLVGKQAVPTPWFATAAEFCEMEGLRVPSQLEVGWQLVEGPFVYYRSQVRSLEIFR